MATLTESPLGRLIDTKVGTRAAWRQTVWGEFLSEFLGTFVLVALGDASVAMAVAALPESGRATMAGGLQSAADWLLIVWGWGFGVVFGVYIAGGISKAHINPAVTLGFAVRRGFPWRKVPTYWAAQLLGAFVAGLLVYLNYKSAIASYEHAQHITRGASKSVNSYAIFATFPASYFTTWVGPFIDQIIGTAFLVGLVFAVVDEYNVPVKANLAPFMIGMVVVVIGVSFGANAGYAINPARDLGPRLVAGIFGWGRWRCPASSRASAPTCGFRSSGR